MTLIESIRWHILGLMVLMLTIYVLAKHLNEQRMNKLINFINKSLPNTPLTPLKMKSIVGNSRDQARVKNEPLTQFMIGMDVKQWTDKFLFYLKENKIKENKNELLLSKLEPFCQSLIDEFNFSSDTDIAFEQHILLMNKLFQLKKKNISYTITTKKTPDNNAIVNRSTNSQCTNLRVLIPGLSLNLNVDYKL